VSPDAAAPLFYSMSGFGGPPRLPVSAGGDALRPLRRSINRYGRSDLADGSGLRNVVGW
jgi:hypothetical protein